MRLGFFVFLQPAKSANKLRCRHKVSSHHGCYLFQPDSGAISRNQHSEFQSRRAVTLPPPFNGPHIPAWVQGQSPCMFFEHDSSPSRLLEAGFF